MDDEQVDDTGVTGNVEDVKDVGCDYYAGDYLNDGVKWSNLGYLWGRVIRN